LHSETERIGVAEADRVVNGAGRRAVLANALKIE